MGAPGERPRGAEAVAHDARPHRGRGVSDRDPELGAAAGAGPAEAGRAGPRVRIGVSACLTGRPVRFDGGHKQNAFVVEELASIATLVPMCPEWALGLGAPREALRLVRSGEGARLVTARSGVDHTERMRAWAGREVDGLAAAGLCGGLCGFVVKKDSPTCGLERVKVYDPRTGQPSRTGVGAFTAALRARLPLLPVEEEGRLNDPGLRDAFLTRIFAVARGRALLDAGPDRSALARFHAQEKLLLLAYDERALRGLGRLVAEASASDAGRVAEAYVEGFLAALAGPPSRGRHVNVLLHMLGHLRDGADRAVRGDVREAIEAYRAGQAPRDAPLTLLRHYIGRLGLTWLAAQTYLRPYPRTLVRLGWS